MATKKVRIGHVEIDMDETIAPRNWVREDMSHVVIERVDGANPVALDDALRDVSPAHAYWAERLMDIEEKIEDAEREHKKHRDQISAGLMAKYDADRQAWASRLETKIALLMTENEGESRTEASVRKEMLKALMATEPKPPSKEAIESKINAELAQEIEALEYLRREYRRLKRFLDELSEHGWALKKRVDYAKILPH